jgi:hypothetical protein
MKSYGFIVNVFWQLSQFNISITAHNGLKVPTISIAGEGLSCAGHTFLNIVDGF